MKFPSLVAVSLFSVLSASAFAQHWSYEGEAAPANWGKLDPKFVMCGMGKNQSPIDLDALVEAELAPLKMTYATPSAEIVNNGHTVQVNYQPGSTLMVDGRAFELKQFHFHAPSENKIGGKQFPMEAHLVHADKDGNLAVVGVMFSEGVSNPFLAKLWEKMPAKKDEKNALAAGLNVSQLLPADKDYYRYNGSLTTPPCTEGVRWLVLKKPATVSKGQVEAFTKIMGHPNNRPVQSVNARPILK